MTDQLPYQDLTVKAVSMPGAQMLQPDESWYSRRHQLVAPGDAGYRAVAMSGRGYGRSSRPARLADYRITELVGDCVGVVRALGASTAVIVGHDWGAQVAWAAAWTRPDVFRAVAGVSVPFPGGR